MPQCVNMITGQSAHCVNAKNPCFMSEQQSQKSPMKR